jgi:quinone-modifying oxidoreductase, subunit QmoB
MENVLGVYICSGCGIGDTVDLEKASKVATGEYKAKVCKTHECLCGPEAVEMIKSDIGSEELDRIVIAACSPRVMTEVFDFGDLICERANYREHLAWSHEPNDEDTDMLAEDMMRMSIVKAQKTKPLEIYESETFEKKVLVVGGGLAGMKAALSAAALGYDVALVEKTDTLGGYLNTIHKDIDPSPPYSSLVDPDVASWTAKVEGNDKIKTYMGTVIDTISGQPGQLEVKLKNGEAFTAGSIVMATGAVPYDPTKLSAWGYGEENPNVVTHADIEKMAKEGKFTRPSDGAPAKRIAFLQCAGSRDAEHLPYCSATCCQTSLKQANYIREKDEEAQIFVFYKDMRTIGQYENLYWKSLDEDNLYLARGEVKGVTANADGSVTVVFDDELLDEEISTEVDLVVLANGMVPSTSETLEDEKASLGLQYRQGPDMPDTKYGFPDSEFICFPYETRRTAMYAAGSVRQPMDAGMTMDDADGAALKAAQAIELLSGGRTVHPRAMDLTFPNFMMSRCTNCKRCTEECPFGAIDEDEKGTPFPNPNRCRRCGICLGACPERIIDFPNYNIDMMASMIKANEVPEEDEEKPRVLVLICENDAYPSFDLAGLNKFKYSSYVRMIPVRCLGSVNVVWISNALDSGFDGVLLIGCKHGDDYQCHYVKGSELANIRMDNVKEKLQQMALEEERVQLHEIALTDYDKIPQIIGDMMETIEEIGPNPFKDM